MPYPVDIERGFPICRNPASGLALRVLLLAGTGFLAASASAQDLPTVDMTGICRAIDPCSGSLDPACFQSSEATRTERRRAVDQCISDQSTAYRFAASEWPRLDMAAREDCLGHFREAGTYTALSNCVSEKLAEKDSAPIN